jgi:hypothetical protein
MGQWVKIAKHSGIKARLAVGVWLSVSVLAALTGCDNGPRVAEYPPREPTAGKAELPTAPNLDPTVAPSQYPDSAWSVRGVLSADKKTLPEWLSVRGYVASLAACPVTERVCKPAPHLYLSDSKEGLGKRLLVGGERDLALRGWKVGDQITAEGKFVTASADGVYYAPAGLLLLRPMVVQDPTATVDAAGKPTAPPAPKSK